MHTAAHSRLTILYVFYVSVFIERTGVGAVTTAKCLSLLKRYLYLQCDLLEAGFIF